MTDRERILTLAQRAGQVTSGKVASALKISRQAAHRKLQALAATGDLVLRGAGRGATWEPSATATRRFRYDSAALAEDRVFAQLEAEVSVMQSLDAVTRSTIAYAVTEMVNNAIEHASARVIEVVVEPRPAGVAFEVIDDGVGAFARLREGLGLASDLEAVQEVSKGKVTTDVAHHTGEGIFFTSKVADRFELEANALRFIVDNVRDDVSVAPATVRAGTRSEARRLLHGLERFREVVLDFRGVEAIGQGFVDEVFRVWAAAHPATRILPQGTNETVAFMLARAGVTEKT